MVLRFWMKLVKGWPLENRTISKPAYFGPLQYRTCPFFYPHFAVILFFNPHFAVIIWILNTWILDSMAVRISYGKVTLPGGPVKYRTFWTINMIGSPSKLPSITLIITSGIQMVNVSNFLKLCVTRPFSLVKVTHNKMPLLCGHALFTSFTFCTTSALILWDWTREYTFVSIHRSFTY